MIKKTQKTSKPRRKRNGNKQSLNLGKLIRKHAYIMKGKKKIYLNVSNDAVQEIISRVVIAIEDNMPQIARIAYNDGRKTIKIGKDKNGDVVYDDVTTYFGYRSSRVIDGTGDEVKE